MMHTSGEHDKQEAELLSVKEKEVTFGNVFGTLIEPLMDELYATAVLLTRDPEKARDAVQNALMRTFQALHERPVTDVSNFRAYVHKALRNVVVDDAKKEKLRNQKVTPFSALNGTSDEPFILDIPANEDEQPENAFERWQADERAMQLIEKLPETYREVVFLHFVMGLPAREVAKKLNLGLEATKSRITRCKPYLQDALKNSGGM